MSPRCPCNLTLEQATAIYFDAFCCAVPRDKWFYERIKYTREFPDGILLEGWSRARTPLTPRQLIRHRNWERRIHAYGGEYCKHVLIDLDLHNPGRPGCTQLFLDQAEVLLRHFLGHDTWHTEIPLDRMTGFHVIRTFDGHRPLADVHEEIRSELGFLAEQHPELDDRARRLHQPTLAKTDGRGRCIEVRPSKSAQTALPGGFGKMPMVGPIPEWCWREYQGHICLHVGRYVEWLRNPSRRHLSADRVLDTIRRRIPVSWYIPEDGQSLTVSVPSPPPPPAEEKRGRGRPRKPEQIPTTIETGRLRGKFWRYLTNWWRGIENNDLLNTAIHLSLLTLYFEEKSQDEAEQYIREWIRQLPDHAKSCSGRLMDENYEQVDYDTHQMAKRLWTGITPITESTEWNMEITVRRWNETGRRLSNKGTWHMTASSFQDVPDFTWNDVDRQAIELVMGAVLGDKYRHLACDVAKGIARLARFKQSQGKPISVGYWETFLGDEFGVIADLESSIRTAALELGLVFVSAAEIPPTEERKGRPRSYAPGHRSLKYLPKPDLETVVEESRQHVAQVLVDDPDLLANQMELDDLALHQYRLQVDIAELEVRFRKLELEIAKRRGQDVREPKKVLRKSEDNLRSLQVEAETRRLSIVKMREAIATVQAAE